MEEKGVGRYIENGRHKDRSGQVTREPVDGVVFDQQSAKECVRSTVEGP